MPKRKRQDFQSGQGPPAAERLRLPLNVNLDAAPLVNQPSTSAHRAGPHVRRAAEPRMNRSNAPLRRAPSTSAPRDGYLRPSSTEPYRPVMFDWNPLPLANQPSTSAPRAGIQGSPAAAPLENQPSTSAPRADASAMNMHSGVPRNGRNIRTRSNAAPLPEQPIQPTAESQYLERLLEEVKKVIQHANGHPVQPSARATLPSGSTLLTADEFLENLRNVISLEFNAPRADEDNGIMELWVSKDMRDAQGRIQKLMVNRRSSTVLIYPFGGSVAVPPELVRDGIQWDNIYQNYVLPSFERSNSLPEPSLLQVLAAGRAIAQEEQIAAEFLYNIQTPIAEYTRVRSMDFVSVNSGRVTLTVIELTSLRYLRIAFERDGARVGMMLSLIDPRWTNPYQWGMIYILYVQHICGRATEVITLD